MNRSAPNQTFNRNARQYQHARVIDRRAEVTYDALLRTHLENVSCLTA